MGKALTPLDADARSPEPDRAVGGWDNQLEVPADLFQQPGDVVKQLAGLVAEPAAPPAAVRLVSGPDLTVDDLHDVFEVPADLVEEPAEPPATLRLGEPDLTVDDLHGMFEVPANPVEEPTEPPATLRLASDPALTVDDLDQMWEVPAGVPPAAIAEASAVVLSAAEDLSEVDEPSSEPARPLLHLVPSEELPFDQVLDDFVDSVQRLTRDWQDV